VCVCCDVVIILDIVGYAIVCVEVVVYVVFNVGIGVVVGVGVVVVYVACGDVAVYVHGFVPVISGVATNVVGVVDGCRLC